MNAAVARSGPRVQLVRTELRTPRVAAAAGIIFSILLIWSLYLLRVSIPVDADGTRTWIIQNARRLTLALNLVPFAGVAFIWFLGVLRDRLGAMEDQFFATVFLGSGLMFLGMIFIAGAAAVSLVGAYGPTSAGPADASAYSFVRSFIRAIMRIYAFKMAAVFMMSTATLALYIRFIRRWIAMLGYATAVLLLLGSTYFDWVLFAFPCWVLIVSLDILIENRQRPLRVPADPGSARGDPVAHPADAARTVSADVTRSGDGDGP